MNTPTKKDLEAQLTACSAAARGAGPTYTSDDPEWSSAYQDIVELRKLYDRDIADGESGQDRIYQNLSLLADVARIARHLQWKSRDGDAIARSIVKEIQEGKYGSQAPIWEQAKKALEELRRLL